MWSVSDREICCPTTFMHVAVWVVGLSASQWSAVNEREGWTLGVGHGLVSDSINRSERPSWTSLLHRHWGNGLLELNQISLWLVESFQPQSNIHKQPLQWAQPSHPPLLKQRYTSKTKPTKLALKTGSLIHCRQWILCFAIHFIATP